MQNAAMNKRVYLSVTQDIVQIRLIAARNDSCLNLVQASHMSSSPFMHSSSCEYPFHLDTPTPGGVGLLLQIPGPVRRWIDQICAWDFRTVISAHFNAPVDATPADLR